MENQTTSTNRTLLLEQFYALWKQERHEMTNPLRLEMRELSRRLEEGD